MMGHQLLVFLFNIHVGKKDGDQDADDHGDPQIHEVQHIQSRCGLDGSCIDIAAGIQQPTGDRSTQAAADLNTQGGAGKHRTVNTLAFGQISVFGAGSSVPSGSTGSTPAQAVTSARTLEIPSEYIFVPM